MEQVDFFVSIPPEDTFTSEVYLAVGATDLRKAVDGLSAIVPLDFGLAPFDPCLFAFCNRRKDRVKILEWSGVVFGFITFSWRKGAFLGQTREKRKTL